MTKKTKPNIKLGFSNGISIITAVFLFVVLLKNSSLAAVAVSGALKLCANVLIPSLFPLMISAEIMTESTAIEKITHAFSVPISKLLGISKDATPPYFLALFGGYTSSCKSAVLLYKNGTISKNDCESLIALSNIPSLAFMTGFIGIGIFKSSTIGWILWAITVISTLILGTVNRLFFKSKELFYKADVSISKASKKLSKIVIDAISHSSYAMLTICACVVFFSVTIAILKLYFIKIPVSEYVKNLTLGMLELTQGITVFADLEDFYLRILSCAFLVGWSGLCIHFQVISLCEDVSISFKKYFIFKGLQAIICTALAWLIFTFKF